MRTIRDMVYSLFLSRAPSRGRRRDAGAPAAGRDAPSREQSDKAEVARMREALTRIMARVGKRSTSSHLDP